MNWRAYLTSVTNDNNHLHIDWPEIISKEISEDSVEISLFVPATLSYFDGHFTEAPILAGVVQLFWAVEYAKETFNLSDSDANNIEVLKFQVVIVPNQHLTLTLRRKTNEKVVFTYSSARGKHASGRIVFGDAA